jgi:hypothetical protein
VRFAGRLESRRANFTKENDMTKQTAFGTIKVQRIDKPDRRMTLTFVNRDEFEKTRTILDGVKELRVVDSFWGYSIFDAKTAIEDVKFWLLDGR